MCVNKGKIKLFALRGEVLDQSRLGNPDGYALRNLLAQFSYFLNKTGSLRAPKDEADSSAACITATTSRDC